MKDCDGHEHPDEEPVKWWQLKRELSHLRDMADQKERDLQKEVDRKAKDVLYIAENRAASTRLFVSVVGILVPVLFGLLMFYLAKR